MKKLTFLFAIVIAVLTFTSCEPEIVNPETQKTEAFNIYEYATTTDFVVGVVTTVNDTTYVIDSISTNFNGYGNVDSYFYRVDVYTNQNKIGFINIVNSIEGDSSIGDENIITIRIFELNINKTISKRTMFVYNVDGDIISEKINIYDENGEFVEQIIII